MNKMLPGTPHQPSYVTLIADTAEDPSGFNYFTVAGSLQKDWWLVQQLFFIV